MNHLSVRTYSHVVLNLYDLLFFLRNTKGDILKYVFGHTMSKTAIVLWLIGSNVDPIRITFKQYIYIYILYIYYYYLFKCFSYCYLFK